MFQKTLVFVSVLILLLVQSLFTQQIISLSWSDVVGISRQNNLDLRIARKDYQHQRLNQWKAYSDFLPSITYQFQRINNIELPEFVFMGQHIRVGTDYNFTHAFQIQYPIFLGGARIANIRIQHSLKKSLKAQLQNKEESVVFQALEAYFRIMLMDKLVTVNRRAREAARGNLEQVQKFYEAGVASQLELFQARSRYSSTLTPLTSAVNAKKIATQNLKFLLNISPDDSLVLLDSLHQQDFLAELSSMKLPDLQQLALKERKEIHMMQAQKKAAGSQKWLAASQFLPNVVFSAAVQHQAQVNTSNVTWDDYTRVKNAVVSVQLPLFQGGKRGLEYQQARILDKKATLQMEQTRRGILLDVENAYHQFREAFANLQSLQLALQEAKEALRLANLNYREGLATQLEVLSAQLVFSSSDADYQQGIYNYNVAQLKLLKAVGLISSIWENNNYRR